MSGVYVVDVCSKMQLVQLMKYSHFAVYLYSFSYYVKNPVYSC